MFPKIDLSKVFYNKVSNSSFVYYRHSQEGIFKGGAEFSQQFASFLYRVSLITYYQIVSSTRLLISLQSFTNYLSFFLGILTLMSKDAETVSHYLQILSLPTAMFTRSWLARALIYCIIRQNCKNIICVFLGKQNYFYFILFYCSHHLVGYSFLLSEKGILYVGLKRALQPYNLTIQITF